MRYLNNHTEFELLNESMFYISEDFRKRLKEIDSPISDYLLSVVGTDVKPDMTFIDISDKDGFVQFSQLKSGLKGISNDSLVDEDSGEEYTFDFEKGEWVNEEGEEISQSTESELGVGKDEYINSKFDKIKGRNQTKIGKLINKIFPGKFKDKEVEEFVNKFKSKNKKSEKFEIVKGDDIAHWYHCNQYSKVILLSEVGIKSYDWKGTLGHSCMKYMEEEVFKIYTDNPDVCRMLILKDEKNKLIGRALVWKVNIGSDTLETNPELESLEYFMDRIYYTDDSDEEKFKNYAKSKGWAYKLRQSYSSLRGIIYNGKKYSVVNMIVNTKPENYDRYPYMDTFASYDPDEGILINKEDYFQLSLRSEDGNADGGGGDWSEWDVMFINPENSIYSDKLGSYLDVNNSTSLTIDGSIDWMPLEHPDVVYNNNIEEYVYRPEATLSEYDYQYYPPEDVSMAIVDINDQGKVTESYYVWHADYDFEGIDGVYHIPDKWGNYELIKEDLLTKDYDFNKIPKIVAINTYEIKDGVWLSKSDALLLKNKIIFDKTSQFDHRVENKVDYFERVWKDKNISGIIKELENKISGKPTQLKLDFDIEKIYTEKENEYLEKAKDKLESLQDIYYRITNDEDVEYTTVEESNLSSFDYTTLPQPKSSKGPLMTQEKPYVHGQSNYKAKGYETTKWSFEDERKGWSKLGLKKFKDFTPTNENKIKDLFKGKLSEDDKVFKDIIDNFDDVNVITYRTFEYNGEVFYVDKHWDVTDMIYYYDNDGKSHYYKSGKFILDLVNLISPRR